MREENQSGCNNHRMHIQLRWLLYGTVFVRKHQPIYTFLAGSSVIIHLPGQQPRIRVTCSTMYHARVTKNVDWGSSTTVSTKATVSLQSSQTQLLHVSSCEKLAGRPCIDLVPISTKPQSPYEVSNKDSTIFGKQLPSNYKERLYISRGSRAQQVTKSCFPVQQMAAPKAPPKVLTLLIVHKLGKVLLGRKKRGFGEGYYNGFGGKLEPGETVEEAAIRELKEEAGVEPVGLESRGLLTFHFDDQDRPWEVHVYHAADIRGEPCETDEMAPVWFAVEDIPFNQMWADDPFWYPLFLEGKQFEGSFHFQNTHTMVSHEVRVL